MGLEYTDRSVIVKAHDSGTAVVRHRYRARDRLLAAADELFYDEGIHTVGIDRVIEKAGVAKATLYSTFGSKDGLIRAYLAGAARRPQGAHQRRARRRSTRPANASSACSTSSAARRARPDFHGCAFVNASAESPPGSVVEEVSDMSRAWTRALFTDLAREAGAADPEQLARQLVQLYDGAMVSARMDRDSGAAATAKATAAAIVDAATASASAS